MFYLVGEKSHEGQDWIYEISEGMVKNAFYAHGNGWRHDLFKHGGYGAEMSNQIIDCVENLDFVCVKTKERKKILEIISEYHEYHKDLVLPSVLTTIGERLWVFKIQSEHREISTLC